MNLRYFSKVLNSRIGHYCNRVQRLNSEAAGFITNETNWQIHQLMDTGRQMKIWGVIKFYKNGSLSVFFWGLMPQFPSLSFEAIINVEAYKHYLIPNMILCLMSETTAITDLTFTLWNYKAKWTFQNSTLFFFHYDINLIKRQDWIQE